MKIFISLTTLIALGCHLLALSQWENFATVKVDSIAFHGKTCMGLERGEHPSFH